VAGALPAAPLSALLRIDLGSPDPASAGSQVLLLAAWAIATLVVAARTFRWD
jgi:hypothetical protein